jgi:hypothetical protein
MAEHSEVPGVEVDLVQALGKAPVRVGAELRQQETRPAAEFPRRRATSAGGFAAHGAAMIPLGLNCL